MEQQVIPMLAYEDGVAAMQWLCEAFDFTEVARLAKRRWSAEPWRDRVGNHIIMLAEPTPDYQGPKRHRSQCQPTAKWSEVPYIINGVLVYVDDVEQHFERAKAKGATILTEIETGGPGTRYRAEDLEGQRWMFMQKP